MYLLGGIVGAVVIVFILSRLLLWLVMKDRVLAPVIAAVISTVVYYFGNDGEGLVQGAFMYGVGAAFWITIWRVRDNRKAKAAAPRQP